jgi:hypothetical protein
MSRKKCRKMVGKMIVIAAVLMMGIGVQTAHAGNLFTSAVNATYAGSNQGLAEVLTAAAFVTDDLSYLYDAAEAMDYAWYYSDEAAYYAYLSSGDLAYYAWLYADEATYYFEYAALYAYYGYLYSDATYALLSLVYGGMKALNIAYAEVFAGVGSNGGSY